MKTIIRSATIDDALGIARVQVLSWKSTYRGIVSDAYLNSMTIESREKRWAQNMKDMFVFVAESDEKIIAFIAGGKIREDDEKYDGELYAIYSLLESQKKGIGRRLVNAFCNKMIDAGYKSMLVWVLANNPSRVFYEKLGGKYTREKVIRIGDENLVEIAYGWGDLRTICLE